MIRSLGEKINEFSAFRDAEGTHFGSTSLGNPEEHTE